METVADLDQILEAILFTASRPMRAKDLAKLLDLGEPQVKESLEKLLTNKTENGIVVLESPEGYQLATNSKYSTQVKNFLNAELREKLTDATVEVLAIIAYRQPISKAEIEAIRGVNSQYSLRNLLMRGLIEKIPNPNDARSVCYQTTTEFLMHMGVTGVKELPEFEKLVEQIKLPQTPGLSQEEPNIEQLKSNPEIPTETEVMQQVAAEATEEITKPENPHQLSETAEMGLEKPTPIEPLAETSEENEEDGLDDDEDDSDDDEE